MNQKLTVIRTFIALFIISIFLLSSCKKDQLIVDQEKVFIQVDHGDSGFPYNSGWQLTLKPDGIADVLPTGDIVWRGTYKISGSLITVKADNVTYKFEIISKTEIKEKTYGTVLKLQ
ncbi:hypothetical protein [Pedobacter boryungensis]|uniref:Uncharacterized protein n=1 Tax=Pedobacter boryungensis TaxID=869962 RepID=A0ABX2DAQ5_9SPHI|nr:hypothetical protein [Pedobacter boryungensis]NQX31107.1 hypothetical protein [Pedobacter boryungensis]